MRKQKEKSRATHVAGDMRKRRLQSLLRVCVALLLPTLYLFYCLSGLYIKDVEMTKLKEQIVWCLLHPLKIYNDKKSQHGVCRWTFMDSFKFHGV